MKAAAMRWCGLGPTTLTGEAKQRELKMLLDVRGKTQAWCFDRYRDQFNRHMLCTQDPRKPNTRDLAIAQKTLTVFGYAEPVPAAMKWLEPLSPILSWNGGDEFKTTQMSTLWGHIQTATDWGVNLPVLMAGTERAEPAKAKSFDPRTIDWKDQRSAVSFINSRPRSGTPAKVAREIRQTVEHTPPAELPRNDWVNAHAWSWFKKAPGADENAEDMPQENAEAQGGARGYTLVTWCVERLPASIRAVGPEELVWRIRMQHNPEQTRKMIQDWPR
jgi:hypothetical protein